ncbi:MAG TPA: DUF4349 domain-containing protein [Firmicutes bacterium]|nr:DUF4349 domain-containing protein [Bacillota bacterium]
MKCVEARQLLSEYADGELDPIHAAKLEEHLSDCTECAMELQLLRAQIRCCAELSDVKLPDGFHEELMARIKASTQHSSAGSKTGMNWFSSWIEKAAQSRYRAVAGVAMVLLLAFVLSRAYPLVGGIGETTKSRPEGVPQVTMQSAEKKLELQDSYGRGALQPAGSLAPGKEAQSQSQSHSQPQQFSSVNLDTANVRALSGQRLEISQKLIKRGSLSLEVPEGSLDKAAQNVQSIVQAAGGYIENSSSSSETDKRGRLYFGLRVPEDRFDSVFEQLSRIGRVVSRSVNVSDVTEQFIDVQAQLRNKETQEQRLLEIMGKANTVGEILQVENELNRVRTDIDSLKQRLKYLENATAMSTIALTIAEPNALLPVGGGLLDSVVQAFMRAARGVLILAASLLPYAAAIAIVWWIIAKLLGRAAKS